MATITFHADLCKDSDNRDFYHVFKLTSNDGHIERKLVRNHLPLCYDTASQMMTEIKVHMAALYPDDTMRVIITTPCYE